MRFWQRLRYVEGQDEDVTRSPFAREFLRTIGL